jgi:hypothetical protein
MFDLVTKPFRFCNVRIWEAREVNTSKNPKTRNTEMIYTVDCRKGVDRSIQRRSKPYFFQDFDRWKFNM